MQQIQLKPYLVYLLFVVCSFRGIETFCQTIHSNRTILHGATTRGDSTKKELTLVFTADEFGEGLPTIIRVLEKQKVKGSFFFTGRFYRHHSFQSSIQQLKAQDHYLGPHSDEHLLYCDWRNRDSLLVTKDSFNRDIIANLQAMKIIGLPVYRPHYFIPPFEWWNDSITKWSNEQGLTLTSFTPGIRTNADYTYPELGATYKSSEWIVNSLKTLVSTSPKQLNGAIILIHAGTDPKRKDKLYHRLQEIILYLKKNGYQFKRIDELIAN
jgi:peptidoglycan/xylan/chitin deacetylase (PgdA/CDA1 family)